MTYQRYGSTIQVNMQADSQPVELDLTGLGKDGKDSLFHPFTTTMVEIVLNREPMPLNAVSRILLSSSSHKCKQIPLRLKPRMKTRPNDRRGRMWTATPRVSSTVEGTFLPVRPSKLQRSMV
jgi:hypothetical protein